MGKSGSKNIFGRPDLPLWRVAGGAVIGYGPFSLFLLIIPPYLHPVSLMLAVGLILLGTISLIWGHFSRNPWAHVLGVLTFNLEFLAIAVRSFAAAELARWYVLLPLYAGFVLAWLLPILSRNVSSRIARELMAPETKAGRLILGSVLSIAPAAGAIGASMGLFSSRLGMDQAFVWLFVAILATFIAIGWGLKLAFDLAKDYHPAYRGSVS